MRKITSLLMLLLFCVSTAWAITYPESEKVYTIKNFHGFINNDAGYKRYMASNANGSELVGATSVTGELCYWQFEKVVDENEHTFYLKNYSNGKYAYIANPHTNNSNVTLSADNKTTFYLFDGHQNNYEGEVFIATQNSRFDNNQTWGIHGNSGMDTWQGAGAGNSWILEEVTFVTVTYNFTYDNAVKYTQTFEKLKDGSEYPDYSTSDFAYGVVAEAKPEGTINGEEAVEGVVTKEIALIIDLPFELSTSFDAAKWYYMNIRSTNSDANAMMKWVAYANSAPYANKKRLYIDNDAADNNAQWAFMGNPFDGIQVVNKGAGSGKSLECDATSTGTAVYAKDGVHTWTIEQGNGGFVLRKGANEYMHDYSSALKMWKDNSAKGDAGSAFQVCAVADALAFETNTWNTFWTAATTYPEGMSTALTAAGGTPYKHEMIMTATSTQMDVHVVYKNASHKINIVGVDVVNNEGKVVASDYHHGTSGGDANKNAYVLNNLTEGATYLVRCYVVDGSKDNDRLQHTNGKILFTDAAHATNDEITTFATTLQTNVASKQDWGGTGYGYYTQASVDAMTAAYDAVTATKNATTISTLIDKSNSLQCILPQPGKFYRLKGKASGKYITGENADGVALASGKFAMAAYNENTWNDAVVFYLTEDGKLLNYRTGRYIDATHSVGGVGQANVITFKPSEGGYLGYLTLMADGHNATSKYLVDDNTELDRQSSYGQNACDWQIEDVTWLPVPMNTTAGYTTLYSPVALKCGDRVNAYTAGDINGGSLTLNPIDSEVIPANTPVILEYIDGAARNCVFLEITESTAEPIASALEGTYADTYIEAEENTDYYVLSMQDNEVGLYKAMININNDPSDDLTEGEGDAAVTVPVNDSFLNNGFKAYLPIVNESGETPVQVLRFNFGGETTAIESVLNNGVDANAPIYDLSGRRVMNAVKGGIYIQNGKKFIVK